MIKGGGYREKESMSSICPHCGAETADKNFPCTHCGKSALFDAVEAGAAASRPPENLPPDSAGRAPLWKLLPWAALAILALLFFVVLPHLLKHKSPIVKPKSAAAPVPVTPRPAAIPAVTVPLTVTLYSASSGQHVRVGAPVRVSAYAALPPGESATLAISYSKNNGPKSLLSLAQGSLVSTAWTPLVPGHYIFTASALDSRKTSAFAQPLSIQVDAPLPAPPRSTPVAPVKLVKTNVPPKAKPAKPRLVKPHIMKHVSAKHTPPAASNAPLPYHVAAATFTYRPVAETLAGALRRRGFHAFVRSHPGTHGKPTYAVETGDYPRQSDAQQQMQLLKHDGYPASIFRAHSH
jgi:cell division septation protein DedD